MASTMVAKSRSFSSCSILISAKRVDMAIPRLTASVWFNHGLHVGQSRLAILISFSVVAPPVRGQDRHNHAAYKMPSNVPVVLIEDGLASNEVDYVSTLLDVHGTSVWTAG